MAVICADVMGMCNGVRRALRIARKVGAPRDTTIVGELVHNPIIGGEMRRKGFAHIPFPGAGTLPQTRAVLVPAHGIGPGRKQGLEAAGKDIIDATCPFVQGIQRTAGALHDEGRFVVVVGRRGHAEVVGIEGNLGEHVVVSAPNEVSAYGQGLLGVLCQSTVSLALAHEVLARVRVCNPGADIRFASTVCPATQQRQKAAQTLAEHSEAVVVVGGRTSNNTRELVQLVEEHGVPCFHVETADEVRPEWFHAGQTVGLTAGASTPDETIERVYQRLTALTRPQRGQAGLAANIAASRAV